MKDFSEDAFQLLNTLTSVSEKLGLLEKHPRVYGRGTTVYPSQIRAIVVVGHNPGMNITELAQRLEITKASASEMITKLGAHGLVRKTRDAGNNKEVILHVTDSCRKVLEDVDRRHEKMFKDLKSILAELKEDSYELVIRVLKRIELSLDEYLNGE